MNDTQQYIGKILGPEQTRDAIHVAVAPVIALENVWPGQHIGVTPDGKAAPTGEPLGIVDPFLRHRVEVGEKFFVFLYPNTVKGMVHHWSHPAFDEVSEAPKPPAPTKAEAQKWLQEFAHRWRFRYGELIDAAAPGAVIVARGTDLHGADELGEDHDLFWKHLEIVTGREFSLSHKNATVWSCSC